ncbi:hypothetical protein ACU4GD_26740 [Cupriavidus basilensis]
MLLLNAQRAQDLLCKAREEFGLAFIAGRRQWVAAFRADPMGKTFDEASLHRLLAPPREVLGNAGMAGPARHSAQSRSEPRERRSPRHRMRIAQCRQGGGTASAPDASR